MHKVTIVVLSTMDSIVLKTTIVTLCTGHNCRKLKMLQEMYPCSERKTLQEKNVSSKPLLQGATRKKACSKHCYALKI